MAVYREGAVEGLSSQMAEQLKDTEEGPSEELKAEVKAMIVAEQQAGNLNTDDLVERIIQLLETDPREQTRLMQKYGAKPKNVGAGHPEGSNLAAGN